MREPVSRVGPLSRAITRFPMWVWFENQCRTWVIFTYDLLSIKTILFDIWDFWCQLEEIRFVKRLFETSHVRFIHDNFSVLITALLDQIQQNLLWKETCQTTAKPADIVLETSCEEYPETSCEEYLTPFFTCQEYPETWFEGYPTDTQPIPNRTLRLSHSYESFTIAISRSESAWLNMA